MKLPFARRTARTRQALFRPVDRENLRWLWTRYLRTRAPWLLLVLLLIAGQGLVYQQFLSLTENGLRVIFEEGAVTQLARVCVLVFVLFVLRGVLSYVTPRLTAWLAANAVLAIRKDLIAHLLTLDLSWFERTTTGEIILRLVNQAEGMARFIGQSTANAVRDAVTIVIVSGYLIWKAPVLFTVAIVVIPVIVLVMQFVSHRIKAIQTRAQAALGDYMTDIEEMSNGMRTVKIAGQEDRERDRLFAASTGIRDLAVRLQATQALAMPSIDMVSAFVFVLVIGGGGYMVISPEYAFDAADLITFLLGLVILFDPLRLLAGYFAQLQSSMILLDGLRSLLRETPTIADRPGATDRFDPAGDIRLEGVGFAYDPEHSLFDDLDMVMPGGRTTAIVGATGSGKTTVLSLMTRLYETQAGRVTIDGIDIRDIRVRALRDAFSVVAQDIVIFNASIWENIRYVRPDATDAEIRAAAEAAEIAELMDRRGDAPLGPKGSQLSGGQKQRIAIARAFLRQAPIVLLDEATSALDQRTEEKVQTALRRLGQGRTTIMVAHRLSSVVGADHIYVMDAGRIIEEGPHEALMAAEGLYAAMFRSQKQSYG
ncbi:ABC transporter ATP-binding protein [Thetidibacter halocola]|uniref:ABC transporter ATP-binding protein n=1 Tax=Thetidibacter halocola TaxID=2827239 RepID=A0A8J7WF55_9RHOB|nr:ABC transporter ATP-binding protein [Thetidibacter halocola]MBS0125667.1 ABC transporter ATP-binding protein [Thetidibacter halocola]